MKRFKTIFTILAFFSLVSCSKTETTTAPIDTTPVVNPDLVDPTAYSSPFAGVPALKDVLMYEVNMRAFSADGNFKGVTARLDSIKALGVNTIWLMPIHPVGVLNSAGQLGSPYSVKNYKEVNPEFGAMEDFQNLVTQAHNRNMAVIIDWVANHTAWDNPWINAHSDFYSKDASGKIIIPPGTNFNDVAQLNYTNATMRLYMIGAMKFWVLKANIDGFRCDYADAIPSDFWKQAIDSIKKIPNRTYILLAEGSKSEHYTSGFQMTYGWDFYNQLKNVYKSTSTAVSSISNTNISENRIGPKLRFTTNHDESAWNDTPVNLFGGEIGALSVFVLSTYLGGVPLIYSGQETGRADKTPFFSKSPINWSVNPDIQAEYKRLLNFRQSSTAIKEGTLETFDDSNVIVFRKKSASEEVLVLVNTRNAVSNYTLGGSLANTNWKNALDNSAIKLTTQISLQPFQYFILKK